MLCLFHDRMSLVDKVQVMVMTNNLALWNSGYFKQHAATLRNRDKLETFTKMSSSVYGLHDVVFNLLSSSQYGVDGSSLF